MLVNLIEKHGDLVQSYSIGEFDQAGPNIRIRAQITFVDNSVLFIRQVVLGESTFKYAYHWQDQRGNLICRWDNSPHWPEIATYPHHKHIIVRSQIVVTETRGGDLDQVFEEIARAIRGQK
ncbi:MAG: hypothetical protein H8D96_20380 [Desulfobacterales bacterium]|uniref:Uncharacterized protein n=1 Tax=Candidatus Desulfatibia vada TaxID=2841696 RepID=A0A8J6TRN9_9BACT|nr:hypothetical protein [Candidatus Desulfatibia vada]